MGKRIALGIVLAVAVFAALVATGAVRVPGFGGGSGDEKPAGTGPGDAADADGTEPGLKGRGGMASMDGGMAGMESEAPEEEVVPSEVRGTAAALAGGVVRGRVVRGGEAKVPVEGASVRLAKPDSLFVYLRADRKGRHDDLVARTDAEGRFTFRDVLPSSGYAVLARIPGGVAATKKGIDVVAKRATDLGDVAIGPAGGLGGHVKDPAGAALKDVRVVVTWQVENDFDVVLADPETLPWVEADTRTKEDGSWTIAALEPGEKTIVLKAPSGAADVLSPITCKEGEQRTDVDAVLGGALTIAGVVVWDDGQPVAGARVFAKHMRKPTGHTMDTGADGKFEFAGIEDGTYQLGAILQGTSVQMGEAAKAGRTNMTITFKRGGALAGTVVSKASGKPIPRFRVTPVFQGEQNWMQQYVSQRVQKVLGPAGFASADGAFRFDRLAAGPYRLVVEADGYPKTEAAAGPVVVGKEVAVPAIEVPDGHRVLGTVVDLSGKPVPDCSIYLTTDLRAETIAGEEIEGAVEDMDADAVTDEHGAFETGLLTPAVYRLGAVAKGRMPANVPNVDLSSGSRRDVKVVLPAGGGIRVRLTDPAGRPVADQRVAWAFEDGFFDSGTTDEKGIVTIQPLRVGRWAVAYVTHALSGGLFPWTARRPVGTPAAPAPEGPARYEVVRRAPGAEDVAVADGSLVEVALRTPRLVRLSVRVRIDGVPAKGRYLGIHGMWRGFQATLDDQGRAVIEGVEPGPWDLGTNVGDEERWKWAGRPIEVPDADDHSVEVDFSR